MVSTADVIVVGGGSAGAVITRRLLDSGVSVHLLEAGGADANPAIHDLGRLGELWLGENDWGYFTVPQRNAFDRRLHWPRGKVLGGSHSLNASIFVRGSALDFDDWEAAGNVGWGWQHILPKYKRIESYLGPASELRGTAGLLDVTTDYEHAEIQESVYRAAIEYGIPENPDYNGASLEGVGWEQLNYRGGKRLSAYRAYVKPVEDDPRLTITTGAWIHRLLFDGDTVTGVEYEQNGTLHQAHAGEVVLSAGALDSPRILLLSGIGPADDLRRLGIEVRLDLPGVGENLHDHLLAPVIAETTTREIPARNPGQPVTQVHWFSTSGADDDRPDTQPLVFSVPMLQDGLSAPASSFSILAGLVTPKSRGTLKLASADPHTPVLLDPNIFDHPEDVERLTFSVREARAVVQQPALAEAWGAVEVHPGTAIDDDAKLDEYVRRRAITYHHQVGTCRLGVDDLAVVDPRLRLHGGLGGIRIADASVIPTITTGNTNAPALVIGEQAADFILSGR